MLFFIFIYATADVDDSKISELVRDPSIICQIPNLIRDDPIYRHFVCRNNLSQLKIATPEMLSRRARWFRRQPH